MDSPSPNDPGPLWLWFTAWSLQGVGVVGLNALGLVSDVGDLARFLLMGVVAAVPLVGLYLILSKRPATSPSQGE